MKQKTMEWFDGVMEYYATVLRKTEKLHEHTIDIGWVDLGCTTKASIKAINNTLHVLNNMRDAMIESEGRFKIPIKNNDKPDLKLIVDNGPIEINFKRLHPNHNPLW